MHHPQDSNPVINYVSKIFSIVTCFLFGYCDIAAAKSIAPESNDRAVQKSVTRLGYIQIPGIGTVSISDPIYEGSNFTWGEATRNGSRIPRDTKFRGELVSAEEIGQNIVKMARVLDEIRSQFGDSPVTINSWYRPPEVNKRTSGAASGSYHLIGLTADFWILNRDAGRVYRTLDPTWPGGLGRYSGRTHADLRNLVGDDLARW